MGEKQSTITQSVLAGRTALLRLLPLSINELKNAGSLPSLFEDQDQNHEGKSHEDKD